MNSYPLTIKVLHWLVACLVICSLASGYIIENFKHNVNIALLLNGHAINGTIILLLMSYRAFFRIKYGVPTPEGNNSIQKNLAKLVHKLFYVVLISTAILGLCTFLSKKIMIYIPNTSYLQEFHYLTGQMHGLFVLFVYILIILHISGFAYHQFIHKNKLFSKMWF
jgi:cytochrome b561